MEYRFLPIIDISDVKSPLVNQGDKNVFSVLEETLLYSLRTVQENYIKVGTILKTIKDNCYYNLISFTREDGSSCPCRSVEEYAYVRFGLSKTVVFNSIAIIEKFTYLNGEDTELYPYLKDFGYSALTELVPLSKNVQVVDDNIGYLPKWVKEEVKSTMTVKELREVKKRHRKVKAVPVAPVEENDEPEFKADEETEFKKDNYFHVFKNDEERRFVLENYRCWDLFATNSFLGISYYRIYVDKGICVIVFEFKDDSKWATAHKKGVGYKYYVLKEGETFKLDEYSISTLLRLFREKRAYCPTRIWDKINAAVEEEEPLTSPKGGES